MPVPFFLRAASAALFANEIHAGVIQLTTPSITQGTEAVHSISVRRRELDLISLANVLVTAIPDSLRQVAATNIPAFSSILWEEFLDDRKPQWFLDLPQDIQTYLIARLGPQPSSGGTIPFALFPSVTVSTTSPMRTTMPTPTPARSQPLASTDVESADPTTAQQATTSNLTHYTSPPSKPYTTVPSESSNMLTNNQKIGIGVGIPLALLVLGALLFGCYFFRRRRRNNVASSVPPSSPGFIPRFAFQQKDDQDIDQYRSLTSHADRTSGITDCSDWDSPLTRTPSIDDKVDNTYPPLTLCHTHSSTRARGRRTSYTNLNPVPEIAEPDDTVLFGSKSRKQEMASGHSLVSPLQAAFSIKRKPIAGMSMEPPWSATNTITRDNLHNKTARKHHIGDVTQPYVEDYGPEYHDGYSNYGDGLSYISHDGASRSSTAGNAATQWPLTDTSNRTNNPRQTVLWDRVYNI